MVDSSFYTSSGTVNRGSIYIERAADEKLLRMCQERKYEYLLTSRQMGKSSLVVQTGRKLRAAGVLAAYIDLQGTFSSDETAERFYYGLVTQIDDQLEADTNYEQWWREHNELGVGAPFCFVFNLCPTPFGQWPGGDIFGRNREDSKAPVQE